MKQELIARTKKVLFFLRQAIGHPLSAICSSLLLHAISHTLLSPTRYASRSTFSSVTRARLPKRTFLMSPGRIVVEVGCSVPLPRVSVPVARWLFESTWSIAHSPHDS